MRHQKAGLIFLGLAGVGWLTLLCHEFRRIRPSETARTLSGFLESMPSPARFELQEPADRQLLFVTGPLPALLTLPSGPPVYVFDRSARLVDWTPDVGDAPSFVERWDFSSGRRRLTRQEAIEWTRAGP